MTAGTVHRLPSTDAVDKTINRTIKTLMADREMDMDEFCTRAEMARTTYYNRMSGRGRWYAVEIVRAADALGVPVQMLVNGLQLPHRDSNTEPAGFHPTIVGRPDDRIPQPRAPMRAERHLRLVGSATVSAAA